MDRDRSKKYSSNYQQHAVQNGPSSGDCCETTPAPATTASVTSYGGTDADSSSSATEPANNFNSFSGINLSTTNPTKNNNSNNNNENGVDDKININHCEEISANNRQSPDFSMSISEANSKSNTNNNTNANHENSNSNMLSDEQSSIVSSRPNNSSSCAHDANASGGSNTGTNATSGTNNVDTTTAQHSYHTSHTLGSCSNDSDLDKDNKTSDNDKNDVASTVFTTVYDDPLTATACDTVLSITNNKNVNDTNVDTASKLIQNENGTTIDQSIGGNQCVNKNNSNNYSNLTRDCAFVHNNNYNKNKEIDDISDVKCAEQHRQLQQNLNEQPESDANVVKQMLPNSMVQNTQNAAGGDYVGAADAGTSRSPSTSSTTNNSNKYNNNSNGKRQDLNDFLNDSGSKGILYNEYVNLLCDADLRGMAAKQRNTKNGNNFTRSPDENKPLLRNERAPYIVQSKKADQKPKSIVKSPSSQTFNGSSSENNNKSFEVNRKPRLSIQCSGSDPERPVLHVQFLSQHRGSNGGSSRRNNNDDDSPVAKSYPPASMNLSYQNGRHPDDDDNNNRSNATPESYGDRPPGSSILSTPSTSTTSTTDSDDESSSSDEDSSLDQFIEAKPPDGGYGWVVVFASFMINLIADGITFSFGVIYVSLLEYFGQSKGKTAWIGSLFMAMPLLSGPIASFLTDRYGCRRVTVAGSILASIGFLLSSFTDSIEMLCFTFGVLAGFGLSLCYVAAVVIVAYYFDKRRSFATGLSVCGSGIGTFLFAMFSQMLIDEYGWRYTTLTLAGVFLNMTVCGLLMRDLEWTTHKAKKKAKLRKKKCKFRVSAESFSVSNSTNTGGTTSNLHKDDTNVTDLERSDPNGETSLADQSEMHTDDPRLFSSLINLPTFVKYGEKVPMEVLELLSTNRNMHNVLLRNYPGLAHSRSFSQPLTNSRQSTTAEIPITSALENTVSPTSSLPQRQYSSKKSRKIQNEQAFMAWLKENGNIQPPHDVRTMLNRHHPNHPTAYLKDLRMHRHSLTYRGAMLNINRYRLRASSCPDIYRNSMTTIAKEKSSLHQGIDEFKAVLIDMLDFSFFADIRFLLFAISNFLLYAWYDVPYVYLADYAKEMGFEETKASFLISIIGIVNMVGEIILGWFGDRKWMTAGMIYGLCMIFCGLVTGLMPLMKAYGALSTVSGLFGLFIAANYALTSIILVELISLDRFTNAYGLLLLVQGVANLLGPPLAGWITDFTKSYNLSFYLAGFFIIISGFLMMILPARGKIRKYRAIRRKNSSGQDDDEDDDEEESEECDEDAERRLADRKISQQQIITAPKSALKSNGTTKNYLIGTNLLNNNESTKINQV